MRHDAVALQDAEPLVGHEAREAVAGEERPVDLLLAVLPVAPLADGGEEHFDVLLFQLIAHELFVPRPGPDRKPTGFHAWSLEGQPEGVPPPEVGATLGVARSYCADARGIFKPISYAFLISSFFQSMIASARSFSMYFAYSPWRFSLAILSAISALASSNDLTVGVAHAFDLEQLVAALCAQHGRDRAGLQALDGLLQFRRQIALAHWADEAAVGLRRRVGQIGREPRRTARRPRASRGCPRPWPWRRRPPPR